MRKDFISKFLNNIVIVGIILTLLALLAAPWIILETLKRSFGIVDFNTIISISIGIYLCAIPYLIALFSLNKICKKLVINEQFSIEIPKYLKQISICAFSEILIFNATLLVLSNLLGVYLHGLSILISVVVSFISLTIGFLSMVLEKLFEIVIEIKDENDKTI